LTNGVKFDNISKNRLNALKGIKHCEMTTKRAVGCCKTVRQAEVNSPWSSQLKTKNTGGVFAASKCEPVSHR
jgi:hypothetical protein